MDSLTILGLIIVAVFVFLVGKSIFLFLRDPSGFMRNPKKPAKLSLSMYILLSLLPLTILANIVLQLTGYSAWLLIINPLVFGYFFSSVISLWIFNVSTSIAGPWFTLPYAAVLWWLVQDAQLLPSFAEDYQTIYGYIGMGLAAVEATITQISKRQKKSSDRTN